MRQLCVCDLVFDDLSRFSCVRDIFIVCGEKLPEIVDMDVCMIKKNRKACRLLQALFRLPDP